MGKIIGCVCAVVFATLLLSAMPEILGVEMGQDWFGFFRPRALHIESLYDEGPTSYAPWAFVPLIPIALLPPKLGYGLLWMCSLAALVACTREWWRALLLVLCWPVLDGLQLGQPDALLSLVFVMPANWALILVSMKPIVLWPWALRSVQKAIKDGPRALDTILYPLAWTAAISLVLWRGWPRDVTLGGVSMPHPQICTWPYLAPLGALFLTRKKERAWLIAAIFLTPYLNPYHLTPILAYIYREERWWVLLAVTAATWLPVLI